MRGTLAYVKWRPKCGLLFPKTRFPTQGWGSSRFVRLCWISKSKKWSWGVLFSILQFTANDLESLTPPGSRLMAKRWLIIWSAISSSGLLTKTIISCSTEGSVLSQDRFRGAYCRQWNSSLDDGYGSSMTAHPCAEDIRYERTVP